MKGIVLNHDEINLNQNVWVQKTTKEEILKEMDESNVDKANESLEGYTIFYKVLFHSGNVCMYLMKGYAQGPNEIVPLYRNGKMNYGYELSLKAAVKTGIEEAIFYM